MQKVLRNVSAWSMHCNCRSEQTLGLLLCWVSLHVAPQALADFENQVCFDAPSPHTEAEI
jgi:hypothetical protein